MELNEIATISGKGGLYHIVKPTRAGVIVETLDDQKKRLPVNANQRISILQEISIYTVDSEGSRGLQEVFSTMHEEFGDDLGVNGNSPSDELRAFMKHVLPEYDEERVYTSDIKKLISWYNILLKHAPDVLTKKEEEAEVEKEESAKEEK